MSIQLSKKIVYFAVGSQKYRVTRIVENITSEIRVEPATSASMSLSETEIQPATRLNRTSSENEIQNPAVSNIATIDLTEDSQPDDTIIDLTEEDQSTENLTPPPAPRGIFTQD